MQLSSHFSLEELTISQTASRYGIDNTPSPEIITHLKRLCMTLEQVRALVGVPIIVSSGYRCPALNRAVGGAKNSAHTLGLAADINAVHFTPQQLAQRVIDSPIPFDQLILEFGAWVHIGLAEGAMRREVLTAKHEGGRTVYVPGME